jgi:hypothetical protein
MKGNPTDKAILKALKNASDRTARDMALKRIRSQALDGAFRSLIGQFQNKIETGALLRDLAELVRAKMLYAAEYIFLGHVQLLVGADMEEILLIAATPKCFQTWLEKAPDSQARLNCANGRIRASPSQATQSVLAWWFFSHAPVAMLSSGAAVLLDSNNAREFVGVEELLAAAFGRDKDGNFLARLMSIAGGEAKGLGNLMETIRSHDETLKLFIRLFPKTTESITLELAKAVPQLIFSGLRHETESRRRQSYSHVLRLAADLMELADSVNVDAILAELDRLSSKIEHVTSAHSEMKDTCGIRYLGHQRISQGTKITDEGADLIALAVDKVHRGDNPLLIVEATAFNLGLRPLGEEGALGVYDPIVHDDTRGGMLPGAAIRVTRKGWKLGERIVERAKVDSATE